MVKLRVKVGAKGQVVMPKVIRGKLGIKPGKTLLLDEKDGKIIVEKFDVEEFVSWAERTRKRIARDVYKFGLEEEFQ